MDSSHKEQIDILQELFTFMWSYSSVQTLKLKQIAWEKLFPHVLFFLLYCKQKILLSYIFAALPDGWSDIII